jgi:hypothetical protein
MTVIEAAKAFGVPIDGTAAEDRSARRELQREIIA